MSLTPNDKRVLNQLMAQLLSILDSLDEIHGVDPRPIDLLEIAGHLLQEQVEQNRFYPNTEEDGAVSSEDNEDEEESNIDVIPPGTFEEQHIEDQASSAVNSIQNGLSSDIIKEGGFQFLNSAAKDGEEKKDIPSPDELKDWFDI